MTEIIPWYRVWFTILIHPNDKTIVKLINQPKITKERAYYWAFIGFIGFSLSLFRFAKNFIEEIFQLGFSCGQTIGMAIIMLLVFVLITAFIQAIATVFGGIGNRDQLAYAFATYIAPLGIISAILSFMPWGRYMVIPLIIYGLILSVIATKATYQLSWIKALLCNMFIFGAFSLCAITSYLLFLEGMFLPIRSQKPHF
jgi:hypothetical protein